MSRNITNPLRSRRALRLSGAVGAGALALGLFSVGVAVVDSGDADPATVPSAKMSRESSPVETRPDRKASREAIVALARPDRKMSREAIPVDERPSKKMSREAAPATD